jgi:hypothetical protein
LRSLTFTWIDKQQLARCSLWSGATVDRKAAHGLGNGVGSKGRLLAIQRRSFVYVRVVRFTGVNAERLEELLARIKESGGPPEGVPTTGLRILFDEDQGTAVVEQYFETAEDMEVGGQAFSAMDSGETPGTRTSVDMCELKLELEA